MRPLPLLPPLKPACSQLLAAWNEARGDDLLPARKALRPALIASILTNTYILEYRSPLEVVFTLVGSAISDGLGYEMTGRNHIEFVAEEERPYRSARWKLMAETPCGQYGRGRIPTQSGVVVPYDNIVLPMRASAEGKLHFIGVIEAAPELQPLIERNPTRPPFQQNLEFAPIDIGAGAPEMPVRPKAK